MKTKSALIAATLLLAISSDAIAQISRPSVGIGSKTMDSCKQDTKKFCSSATERMQKECLVKNWMKISSDCQDAVANRGREGGGG
jgi:predicted nucleic acid binding AN1-type Zn finger protein